MSDNKNIGSFQNSIRNASSRFTNSISTSNSVNFGKHDLPFIWKLMNLGCVEEINGVYTTTINEDIRDKMLTDDDFKYWMLARYYAEGKGEENTKTFILQA